MLESKHMKRKLIMPETPATDLGRIVVEDVDVGGRTIKISKPATPEQLLDLKSVEEAYALDEYMPYWATIWPVAVQLSSAILRETFPPGARAIEIGCGLGLPGIAALMAGLDVTFSDYDETAVRFAGENARLNGFSRYTLLPMDWRHPTSERFDVVIASDLVYEARLVEPIAEVLDKLIAPGGRILLADQNRAYADKLQAELRRRGFLLALEPFGIGTIYRIERA